MKSAPPFSSHPEAYLRVHEVMIPIILFYTISNKGAIFLLCMQENAHSIFFSLFNIFDAALIWGLNSPQYSGQPEFIFTSNLWVHVTQKD